MIDERTKLAFDSAYKTVVQLVTLASATIAVEVSLLKDLAVRDVLLTQIFAVGSWVFFLFSIVCGVAAALELTGDLDLHKPKGAISDSNLSIYKRAIRLWAGLQIILFLAALILTIVLGFLVLSSSDAAQPHTATAARPCAK